MTNLVAENNLSDLTNTTTARGNLGLGTMAVQNANSVNITGGIVTGISSLTSPLSSKQAVKLGDSNVFAGGNDGAGRGAFVSAVKTLTGNTTLTSTEFTAFFGGVTDTSPTGGQKGAVHAIAVARGFGGTLHDTVPILAQAFMEGTGNNIWGSCIDVYKQAGTTGQMLGIEVGIYNSSNTEQPTLDQYGSMDIGIWINTGGGGKRSTAAIQTAQGTSSEGFFYGCVMDWCHKTYFLGRNPKSSNAVLLACEDSPNWGRTIVAPRASSFVRHDGSGGQRLIMAWDNANNLTIGNANDALVLDLTNLGLGQRYLLVGAPDSAGTGCRALRVFN